MSSQGGWWDLQCGPHGVVIRIRIVLYKVKPITSFNRWQTLLCWVLTVKTTEEERREMPQYNNSLDAMLALHKTDYFSLNIYTTECSGWEHLLRTTWTISQLLGMYRLELFFFFFVFLSYTKLKWCFDTKLSPHSKLLWHISSKCAYFTALFIHFSCKSDCCWTSHSVCIRLKLLSCLAKLWMCRKLEQVLLLTQFYSEDIRLSLWFVVLFLTLTLFLCFAVFTSVVTSSSGQTAVERVLPFSLCFR